MTTAERIAIRLSTALRIGTIHHRWTLVDLAKLCAKQEREDADKARATGQADIAANCEARAAELDRIAQLQSTNQ